jgi:signal transduction histidine kinase
MTSVLLETEVDSEQREFLETVQESAGVLLRLISDILDLSKLEAGKVRLEQVPLDIESCVTEIVASFADAARAKGLSLKHRLEPGLPAQVMGDPAAVQQMLSKLIENALKFTEEGEVSLLVQRESAPGEPLVLHFIVADTGIGIPLDRQASIFDAFVQADGSHTRRHGGAGLGLAICADLVRLMGGRIWLESKPRVGSCFHVTAPFEGADAVISSGSGARKIPDPAR